MTKRQEQQQLKRIDQARKALLKLDCREREALFKEASLCSCASLTSAIQRATPQALVGLMVGGLIGAMLGPPKR